MEIQSFNDKDFKYFNNALCEIEAEEKVMDEIDKVKEDYI